MNTQHLKCLDAPSRHPPTLQSNAPAGLMPRSPRFKSQPGILAYHCFFPTVTNKAGRGSMRVNVTMIVVSISKCRDQNRGSIFESSQVRRRLAWGGPLALDPACFGSGLTPPHPVCFHIHTMDIH